MNILLISIFEGGYQPMSISTAYQSLCELSVNKNIEISDVYVHGIDENKIEGKDIIFISVPLFDTVIPSVELLQKIKSIDPKVKVCFFGQHATIHAKRLIEKGADYCVIGDWEKPIKLLIQSMSESSLFPVPGIMNKDMITIPEAYHSKKEFSIPNRNILPSLEKYPNKQLNQLLGKDVIAGSTELARGCKHKCSYCSVYAAYQGSVIKIPIDIILSDVSNLVDLGMTHLTFIDADWFSTKNYGIEVLREIHKKHPHLTFDITTRVDHIISNENRMTLLKNLNVRIITSALEFPNQSVLNIFNKQVTVKDTEKAIKIVRENDIILNPTFIMYNPWVNLQDIEFFQEWIDKVDLRNDIDPIQFETRLSLYKGSPLLETDAIKKVNLIERDFYFDWTHHDPWVDELYFASLTPQEDGIFKRCCIKC